MVTGRMCRHKPQQPHREGGVQELRDGSVVRPKDLKVGSMWGYGAVREKGADLSWGGGGEGATYNDPSFTG